MQGVIPDFRISVGHTIDGDVVHPLHGKLGEAGKLANFRCNCKPGNKMIPQDWPYSSLTFSPHKMVLEKVHTL